MKVTDLQPIEEELPVYSPLYTNPPRYGAWPTVWKATKSLLVYVGVGSLIWIFLLGVLW